MIRNQWYAVLDAKELKKDKLLGVTRLGEKLVFWRDKKGGVGCIFDKCTHRGASLSKGRILSNNMVQCPFHGFEYDKTGKVTKIPANGKNTPVPERYKVHGYPVKDAHGLIWMWWGEPQKEYPPLPFFEDLESFFFATYKDYWPVHYSRAIENQLDVVHLPFVHYNTIGRGCRTLIDGPKTKWVDNELRVWAYMRVDNGTKPLKENELQEPTRTALLHFRFGNIWQNRLGTNFRIFAAFAPIDDENTIIYLRLYQKIIRLPLLGRLLTRFSHRFNRRILKQDKRVVSTQLPKKTSFKMNEHLIQGDKPIIEYRKKRDELLKLNNK
ncbi:MAG: aromatic ring-hydroxylating dioxygenase subunit alpha [Candidatus Heimdallarchaeota archaeon]|nr:aromatic ring-hydroxylating dioxygenase subunit alpha [Candidatus Heimdallarchaeota archaeon]MBY8993599.1 aromatic ring-hydroxylating dioxygenase subunit alpha [Candidatus Heimdallarchaeota archaeon]